MVTSTPLSHAKNYVNKNSVRTLWGGEIGVNFVLPTFSPRARNILHSGMFSFYRKLFWKVVKC